MGPYLNHRGKVCEISWLACQLDLEPYHSVPVSDVDLNPLKAEKRGHSQFLKAGH